MPATFRTLMACLCFWVATATSCINQPCAGQFFAHVPGTSWSGRPVCGTELCSSLHPYVNKQNFGCTSNPTAFALVDCCNSNLCSAMQPPSTTTTRAAATTRTTPTSAANSCMNQPCAGQIFAQVPGRSWSGRPVCGTELCSSLHPYVNKQNFGCTSNPTAFALADCCNSNLCSQSPSTTPLPATQPPSSTTTTTRAAATTRTTPLPATQPPSSTTTATGAAATTRTTPLPATQPPSSTTTTTRGAATTRTTPLPVTQPPSSTTTTTRAAATTRTTPLPVTQPPSSTATTTRAAATTRTTPTSAANSCMNQPCAGQFFAQVPGRSWSGRPVCGTELCSSLHPYVNKQNFGCTSNPTAFALADCCNSNLCSQPPSTTPLPASQPSSTTTTTRAAAASTTTTIAHLTGTTTSFIQNACTSPTAHDAVFDLAMLKSGFLLDTGNRVLIGGSLQLPFLKVAAGTALIFDPSIASSLRVGCLDIEGSLLAGSASCPQSTPIEILLDSSLRSTSATCWSDAEVHVRSGGAVRLYGAKGRSQPSHSNNYVDQSWTSLSEPAQAGSRTLRFNANMMLAGWTPGDKIVIATTDYDPRLTEEKIIATINGGEVTLTDPLSYYHHGSPRTSTIDVERAEVGLLSRSIKIAAVNASHGGHTIAVQGFSSVVYSGVEFQDLGLEQFGRYPVHFHNAGRNHGEALLELSAVHGSRFRCMTVHSTANVRLAGNVCYNNRGHNVFFEDGPEHSVIVEGNLVLGVKQIRDVPPLNQINELRSDRNSFVSAFWFKSADNITVRDNVAAGARGVAYMFAFCRQHKGDPALGRTPDLSTEGGQWAEFNRNIAHSYERALWNEPLSSNLDQSCKNDSPSGQSSPILTPASGRPYVDWVPLRNFGMFKIFGRGIWARSTRLLWIGGFCSDARNCVETLQGGTIPIREGVIAHVTFIGESPNKGNFASSTAPDGQYQRTLPDTRGDRVKPSNNWNAVNEGDQRFCFASSCKGLQTSVVLYDGPDLYANCRFVGFNSERYCAFSPRHSWDNNQHSTATELFEPILEIGAQLNDLVCLLPGPGFDLSTPDRLLFNMKITQSGQTSWLVRDHPFYTDDGRGSCITISGGNNPLAHCTGVRFALAMVGTAWARNERGRELPLSRTNAALPVKVGGSYVTSHPSETTALAYDYEGVVHINGQAWGRASVAGLPYKLHWQDAAIPNGHMCRLAQTCNPAGALGLCIPHGGGYDYRAPLNDHFDCVCLSGSCCEAGHRCFEDSLGFAGARRLQQVAEFEMIFFHEDVLLI